MNCFNLLMSVGSLIGHAKLWLLWLLSKYFFLEVDVVMIGEQIINMCKHVALEFD